MDTLTAHRTRHLHWEATAAHRAAVRRHPGEYPADWVGVYERDGRTCYLEPVKALDSEEAALSADYHFHAHPGFAEAYRLWVDQGRRVEERRRFWRCRRAA